MIPYVGDFAEDETVYHYFNTFDSNDPSASVTITNLADADLKVHKDGGTTEATTDGATVSIDFDTITGTHLVTIDTSVDAFYATGSDYMVRMEGTTVDGATINAALFTFSIQNRYSAGALRPTTAGRTLDVNATGEAGIDLDNTSGTLTSADITSVGSAASVTAGVTLANGAVTNASLAGNMEIVFETDFATNYNATRNAWATNVQDFVGTSAADPFNGQVVSASVTGNVGGNVTGSVGSNLELGPTEVNAEVDTALSDIHLDHLFATDYDPATPPGNATAWANELVESDAGVTRFTVNALENAPGGSSPTAAAIADAVWDETLADHLTAGSTGSGLNSASSAGDPWNTALPGAYTSGTAGNILGNNLDTPVSNIETDTQDIQSRLPSVLVGGKMDSDVTSISGDATAADNLEAMYDGTGYVDDTAPAARAQIGQLSVGAGGLAVNASSAVVTTGTPTGAVTDTEALDGTVYNIAASGGNTDFYFEFNVGSDGVATAIEWSGYAQAVGDTCDVQFYDWDAASFVTVQSLVCANGTTVISETFNPVNAYTGTGSNVGLVRLRFNSTTATNIATDRIRCVYSQASSGVANGSTVTLSSTTTNTNFQGQNWVLALGGQDIGGSYFEGAKDVSGTGTCANGSGWKFRDCKINGPTITTEGRFVECDFDGTTTFTSSALAVTDEVVIRDGNSDVAGSGSPTLDWTGVTKATSINVRGWHGGGTWNLTSDCTASIEVYKGGGHSIAVGGGDVEFRGQCRQLTLTGVAATSSINLLVFTGPISVNGTGGTVNVYGSHSGITDNSGGSVTINDFAIETDGVATTTALATVDTNVDSLITQLTTVEGKVDTVDTNVDAILVDTGTTLPATLTTIEGKIDTVDTNVDAVLVDTGTTIPATIATIDTVVDNLNLGIIYGAAVTGTLSTTQATTDLTGYTDDQLIGRTIIVTSGVAEGEGSDITDYAETNGTLTFTAMTFAMGNGDTFKIV